MGVIKKQSLLNAIISYVGIIIGMVNIIYVYPLMPLVDMGILQFCVNTAMMFAPFAGWGFNTAAVHFFPIFKDTAHKEGFFWYFFNITALFTFVFCCLLWLNQYYIATFFEQKNQKLFLDTLNYTIGFTILITYSNLFQSLASNIQKIIIPSLISNYFIKISQPLLILSFIYGFITFSQVFKGIFWTFAVVTLTQFLYLVYLKQVPRKIQWTLWQFNHTKPILSYSSFIILVSISSILTVKLDQIIIAPLLGYASLAVFNFGASISEAIDVARKSISAISAPLISDLLKKNDIPKIEEIYKKSALLQLIIGIYLLIGVWVCADSLFALMPKNGAEYATGKYAIIFLCLARVVDMATGTNHEIITYSKYYRFNLWSLIVLAVLNIGLNILFIPYFGITGVALATFLSSSIFNLMRLLFILLKFKIQPFDLKMIWVILFATFAWTVSNSLTNLSNPYLNILFKGTILSILYIVPVVLFKISKDINDTLLQLFARLQKLK